MTCIQTAVTPRLLLQQHAAPKSEIFCVVFTAPTWNNNTMKVNAAFSE
jgi:hypothetical protein